MEAPRNGWKFVAWWGLGLLTACFLAYIGQTTLAGGVVGGLMGATVPRKKE